MKLFKKSTALVLLVAFLISLMPMGIMAEETADEAAAITDVSDTEEITEKTETAVATSIFADVDESTPNKAAIEELYTKKIVDGYLDEAGVRTFKPEATITRGEFSKLLSVAMPSKMPLNMSETSSGFADVDADPTVSWTIPYVKAAANAAIVNGYEDGTFRAKNPVTYAEAVKMIVCTMGYATKVEVTDPWYTGYITISDQLKIRQNAMGNGDYNSQITRGLVAQLISNMLASDYIISTIVPGINDNTANFGNGGSGIVDPEDEEEPEEAYGMMTGAFDYTLTGESMDLSKTEVMIDDEVYDIGKSKTIDEMYKLVGYNVEIEYEKQRSKNIITKIEKSDATDLEISDEQILYIEDLVVYYEDESSKEKKVKFTDDTYVFYNNVATGAISNSDLEDLLYIENGYMEIIDNDSNKTADVARIFNYKTYFVGAKDSSSNTITDLYTSEKVVLGEAGEDESEDVNIQLCDNSGKLSKAYFSTIAKNSVLSIAEPYRETADSVTEVIISKRTVKGDVTKKGDDYFTIAGKQYKTTAYYDELVESNPDKEIKVGDSGTYYLDFNGDIVSNTVSENRRYGYIVDIDAEDSSNSDPIVRMITSTGKKITDFTFKENVSVNGRSVKRREAVRLLEDSASAINDGSGKFEAGYADSATYAQPVIFETTSSTGTVISSIKTVANGTEENESDALEYDIGKTMDGEKLTYYTSGYSFRRGSSERVFSMTFSSTSDYKANIFVVPSDRSEEDEYEVYTSASYFKNGYEYVVDAFNVDPSSNYGNIIVVYGGSPVKIDGSNKACIITNIEDIMNDENEVLSQISYLELGTKDPEPKTVTVENESLISGLNKGDIIKFATKNNQGTELTLVERVVVDGVIYEAFNDEDTQEEADDFKFVEKYGTDTDYFNAMVARVYYADETAVQLIPGYEIPYEETDPEINDVYDSAEPYTVSTSATYVIIVNSSKLLTDDGIKYYTYGNVSLNSITANGLGLEDLVYIQRSGTGRITGIVIYR